MNKGFCTVVTEDWLDIAKNLIDSVMTFSEYDIAVTCINFDHDFGNDRVISKRKDITKPTYFNICRIKPFACLNSPFDTTLLLDGDMIVLPNIDNIFDDQKHVEETEYPLCAQHPHDPSHKFRKSLSSCGTEKTPRMKWVYANYIFTKKHDWFFYRILDIMEKYAHLDRIPGGTMGEEAAVNAVLADVEADTNMGYNYFPMGLPPMIDYYFDNNDEAGTKYTASLLARIKWEKKIDTLTVQATTKKTG